MLKTRVITAVVMLLVLLGVLGLGGPAAWAALVLVLFAAALWEWARLGGMGEQSARLYAAAATAVAWVTVCFADQAFLAIPLMLAGAAFWLVAAPLCLGRVSIAPFGKTPLFLVLGFVLVSAACMALLLAKSKGVVFLLSVMAICWVADVFAYIFGKTLGKNKLAPRISPGKSWEGAVGGAFSVVALSWGVVFLAQSHTWLQASWQYEAFLQLNPTVFTISLLVLSAFSVVGDLFESMLKRSAGMKDSSQLLPGHGGVLDRIDAQLPVLPLALLLVGANII